jgi:type IV secretory pathway TraG/TraD family ATPase VirD4
MALQTIAAMDDEARNNLLANPSTVAVTPGCMPFDAEYFSELCGEVEVEKHSWTYDAAAPAVGPRRPSTRIQHEQQPRFTPTEVRELEPFHTIVTVFDGTRSHPARKVHARHVH